MSNIPRSEHPRPDRHRESWINFNGQWDFEIDNAKLAQRVSGRQFGLKP